MAVTYGSVVQVLETHGFVPDSSTHGQTGSTSQKFVSTDPVQANKSVVLPNISPQKEMPLGVVSLIGHHTGIPLADFTHTTSAAQAGIQGHAQHQTQVKQQNPMKRQIKPFAP